MGWRRGGHHDSKDGRNHQRRNEAIGGHGEAAAQCDDPRHARRRPRDCGAQVGQHVGVGEEEELGDHRGEGIAQQLPKGWRDGGGGGYSGDGKLR